MTRREHPRIAGATPPSVPSPEDWKRVIEQATTAHYYSRLAETAGSFLSAYEVTIPNNIADSERGKWLEAQTAFCAFRDALRLIPPGEDKVLEDLLHYQNRGMRQDDPAYFLEEPHGKSASDHFHIFEKKWETIVSEEVIATINQVKELAERRRREATAQFCATLKDTGLADSRSARR